MLDLYYWPTPNGKKVTIQLEECGLDYNLITCNIGKGDQFAEEFLAICPNNKMPALVDHDPAGGGEPISIFESGAIMLYIAEKTGQFMPNDLRGKYQVMQWVIWQMANQGPKSGECGHFRRLSDSEGDQSYAVGRFTDEVNRFYGVLNNQLYQNRYICGDEYTIADMICYPWSVNLQGQGQHINDFKYFKRWSEELSARPGLQQGMAVGSDMNNDYSSYSKQEIKAIQGLLYNQRARPAPETGGLGA
ncbi:MAG: GST-like protein [Dinoroseobacter sp.]|jgi:GST-like protein